MNFIQVAHAQTFSGVIDNITGALELIFPVLFTLATIIFLWGVILYLTAYGDEDKTSKGKQYMLWGLIGLFVMVSVWGIVRVIETFVFGGLGASRRPPGLPNIPGSNSGSGNIFVNPDPHDQFDPGNF